MTVTSNAGAAAVGQHAALFELADATSGANLLTGLQRPQPGALASHFGHKQQPQHPPTCPHAAGARLPGGQHQAHAAAPTPAAQQSPRDGSAAQLNQQLGSLEAGDSLRRTVLGLGNDGTSGGTAGHLPSPAAQAGQRVGLGSMVLRVGDMLQPQGEAHGDATLGERAANVLTSLPFLALGWHMHRWVPRLAAALCQLQGGGGGGLRACQVRSQRAAKGGGRHGRVVPFKPQRRRLSF
jgi:hypothetical protein